MTGQSVYRHEGFAQTTWAAQSACAKSTADFFPIAKHGHSKAQNVARQAAVEAPAKLVCQSCPVRAECLEWALTAESDGIWGGTNGDERDRIRRDRKANARKQRRNTVA